jgi:hypothetical protein
VLLSFGIKTVPIVKLILPNRDLENLNLALNKISGLREAEMLAASLEELAPFPNLT